MKNLPAIGRTLAPIIVFGALLVVLVVVIQSLSQDGPAAPGGMERGQTQAEAPAAGEGAAATQGAGEGPGAPPVEVEPPQSRTLESPPYPPATASPPPTSPAPDGSATPTLETPILRAVAVPTEVLKGEVIAFLEAGNVHLLNAGSRLTAPLSESGNISALYGWSADNRWLLVGVGARPVVPESEDPGGHDLWVVAADGTAAQPLHSGLETLDAVWSPVEARVAFTTRQGDLYVADAASGQKVQSVLQVVDCCPAWAPRGDKLAYVQLEDPGDWAVRNIAVLDPISNAAQVLVGDGSENFRPVWSTDGEMILFESTRPHPEGSGVWYLVSASGGEPQHLGASHPLIGSQVTRSPTADRIAFQQGGAVWLMDFSGLVVRLAEGSEPSWSPDGERLAYTGAEGGLWIITIDGLQMENITANGTRSRWSR